MRICGKCGTKLTLASRGGLCPKCFLLEGLTSADVESPADGETLADGEATPSPSASPAIPGARIRYFGDYELLEEIAHGGMGVIYKARQVSLNRTVAVKMILSGLLAGEKEVKRFHAEAEAAANLDHPNIVPIYEVGQHEGQHYYSMRFIDGRNLATRTEDGGWKMADGGAPPSSLLHLPSSAASCLDVATLVVKLARAVHYAHQRGILHRDLKPANILLDTRGEPQIADFGLARRTTGDGDLTVSGAMMGTPHYASPEQAAGKTRQLTTATDLYSLGAILFFLLTRRPPFEADSTLQLLRMVEEQPAERPSKTNSAVDRDLDTICLKCLEKDPQRRYASADALADDLERWLRHEPILARRSSTREHVVKWVRRKPALAAALAAATALLLLGVAGISWQWRRAVTSEHQARLSLYAADMGAVQQAIEDNNLTRALKLLNLHRPRKGEVDLRSLDWRYLWQRSRGNELVTVTSNTPSAGIAKFSPDGTWFATGRWKAKVIVQETSSKRILATLPAAPEWTEEPCLAISPDGRMLAVHALGGIDVWSTTNWSLIRKLEDGRPTMAFSEDSSLLAARCSQVSKIRVWQTRTWETELHEVGGVDTSTIKSGLAFLPGGRLLAVFPTTGVRVRLLGLPLVANASNTSVRGLRSTPGPSPGAVQWVAGHPEGHQFATASQGGIIHFWSLPDLQHLGEITDPCGFLHHIAYSPDGKRLASSGGDTTVRIWDVATRTNLATLRGHKDSVSSVDFSPDGRLLLTSSTDNTCKLWDVAGDGNPQAVKIGSGSWHIRGRCWMAANGRQLITFAATNRLPELRDFERDAFVGPPRRLLAHLDQVTGVSFDARTALVQLTNDVLEVWDIPTERRIGLLNTTITGGGALSFIASPDNRFLYEAVPMRRTSRIWDLSSGRLLKVFEDYNPRANGMAFSPDGRVLARAATNHACQLWDIESGRVRRTLRGYGWHMTSISYSSDGRFLAVSNGREVRVWDPVSGKRLVGPITGGKLSVFKAGFSLDGKTLLTSGGDDTVRMWNLATGRETAKLDKAASFSISPDDRSIAIWDPDWLRLVHVPSLEEIDQAK